jgi:hypothetical protein
MKYDAGLYGHTQPDAAPLKVVMPAHSSGDAYYAWRSSGISASSLSTATI